jgi:isochorismate pyruvate lyase
MKNHTQLIAQAAPSPAQCRTMKEVRAGVDAIDRELVSLMAERQRFMEAAARIKNDRSRIYDRERVEDVVAKVVAHAELKGLCARIAEPVWRSLIAQCIRHELEFFDANIAPRGQQGGP